MDFSQKRLLGQTGLEVGRLGVAGSYGGPAEAFEEAFERGCNYFYWSTPRKKGMRQAIRNICDKGKREELVIVIQSYSRSAFFMEYFLKKGLKDLGLEYVDVLLLGWHNKMPSRRILNKAQELRERGLCRFLGMSGHNRKFFPEIQKQGIFDLFHVRYNAAHRGSEKETFEKMDREKRPGIATYTATRWGHLLNPKKMPKGVLPPSASDCYRFVLSNPSVDVCMCGPRNTIQMKEALNTLELGPLNQDEIERMKFVGDHVHKKSVSFFNF